ncbi:MAG: hypothetical protein FRX49_06947 [Trebouxia sp. A1-2]|nr:MAG: hypothetical protein FRX49_06947 [Trebouxia sp. A1-2]
MADVLEVDPSLAMEFNKIATQMITPPFENIHEVYAGCWRVSEHLRRTDLMQTHNLTPFTGAEVKSAFHDFTEHQLDVQEGALSHDAFGRAWNAFLEKRHKELHGQNLPMQEDGPAGVASGSQNPAAASHVTEQHAAHNVAPLTGLPAAESALPSTADDLSDSRGRVPADKEVAKDTLVKTILETNSLSTEEKAQRLQAIFTLFENRPAVVSSARSNSRSSQPESFHGRASDHGQAAQTWLDGLQLYFQAEPTPNPVAKAVTYLQDDARYWWQQVGHALMPVTPTLDDFAKAFLVRYVKPSDSAAARKEISNLKQLDSVEAYASKFRNVNSRITVGSPIDTTTLATYFVNGLKPKVSKALATNTSLDTLHDLELTIAASEEMEARLNLADKQAPAVAALGHTQGRVAPHRGSFSPARPRNNTPYARGNGRQSASTAYPRGNTFGRGNAFGRTSSQQSFTPTRGANSQPVVSRGAFNNRVAGPTGGRGQTLRCAFCHKLGHSAEECQTIERALDFRNGRQQRTKNDVQC